MSWLDRVRNALPFTAKRDTADNLWHKCRQCQQMVFVKEWEDNLNVCPRCDHHDRIGATERFRAVVRRRAPRDDRRPRGTRGSAEVPRHQEICRPYQGGAGADRRP